MAKYINMVKRLVAAGYSRAASIIVVTDAYALSEEQVTRLAVEVPAQ